MPGKSPFAEDWRECLRAHYAHVVNVGDKRTEKSLTAVLQGIGYSDKELLDWKLYATMRDVETVHQLDDDEVLL